MTEATMMTSEAANTTEAPATSTPTDAAPATVADAPGQQQAPEGQAAEAAPAEASKTNSEAKPQGAPETYEFKAPEGKEFNPEVLAEFSAVAKELNLSNESAQLMLDKIGPALANKQQAMIDAAREQWATDSKSDKEFGGDKLNENMAVAQKALETFGTPELRTLLNESGIGNHPEIIRAFYRAGKAISEDGYVAGKGGNTSAPSIAQQMYPNMNP